MRLSPSAKGTLARWLYSPPPKCRPPLCVCRAKCTSQLFMILCCKLSVQVLYIHTGGLFGLYSEASELQRQLEAKERTHRLAV